MRSCTSILYLVLDGADSVFSSPVHRLWQFEVAWRRQERTTSAGRGRTGAGGVEGRLVAGMELCVLLRRLQWNHLNVL